MFKIIEKIPKVKIFKGKVKKSKKGLMKKLIRPKTKPKTKMTCHLSVILKPKKELSGKTEIFTPLTKTSIK